MDDDDSNSKGDQSMMTEQDPDGESYVKEHQGAPESMDAKK